MATKQGAASLRLVSLTGCVVLSPSRRMEEMELWQVSMRKKKAPGIASGPFDSLPASSPQQGVTFVAHGPFRPCPTWKSTFWPSFNEA